MAATTGVMQRISQSELLKPTLDNKTHKIVRNASIVRDASTLQLFETLRVSAELMHDRMNAKLSMRSTILFLDLRSYH